MRYTLHISRLLIFFYLFATSVSAAHIHEDMHTVHSECKICMLTQSMDSGDVPDDTQYVSNLSYYLPTFTTLHPEPTCIHLKGYYSQAPPLFS